MAGRSGIVLHTEQDFEGLRAAGRLAAATLDMITPFVKPGVTTEELDRIIHEYTLDHGAIPAPLNYRGYPKASCISINHVVCHGIPSEKRLQEGDIVNIDVTSIVDGWYGDNSRMYTVGRVPVKAAKLIKTTYDCLMRGIEVVRPGATLGDIGHAIQTLAEKNRYSIVQDFCGHGIGRTFHAEPNVLHYGRPGEGMKLKAGMVFTIEPMLNIGKPDVKILDDGWTAVTRDRSLSAQFEHMLGVTETGFEIFTLSPAGYTCPPYPVEG
ncbi:type I methionyl aminopeptidase [Acetobacter indonesiensis]|jgi:methionyl aminopeptidase|uniref:Methionine aminopeptidase n=1 Tax=Acetobacter indonesiensis TaxID=104101 RepID=A0A252ATL3_9PROT|nr:type I methionyl aminopeptidase [Acetobacter indonesiensis]MCG0995187.1 type I methionyl aminopeptidase [Acetobacter indonesiensis]MCI1437233.1 type I methionyl aminopeptidase [Acetobacter indonesiensis]MCI1546317.1 type I methionyl aminopeptidase [Acetobacter indonesiensis]MCI1765693.1 type I methionyl aminopeptidase [Acetobacter indonesiensis]MCP1231290.1 type I methionyl aminopeptidase [Acetobacter indonesiensis]